MGAVLNPVGLYVAPRITVVPEPEESNGFVGSFALARFRVGAHEN